MSSVLFVFVGWSYWAFRYQDLTPVSALLATLFGVAFFGGLLMLWLGISEAFGFCVLIIIIYWCVGLALWRRILNGNQRAYPGLVL